MPFFVIYQKAQAKIKKGYAVRGSVRSLFRTDEVINGIKKEIDPKGNLEFCELDLMHDAVWDKARKSCDYVLHVATPFKFGVQWESPGTMLMNLRKLLSDKI